MPGCDRLPTQVWKVRICLHLWNRSFPSLPSLHLYCFGKEVQKKKNNHVLEYILWVEMTGNMINQHRNWHGLDQLSAMYGVRCCLIFKVTVSKLSRLEKKTHPCLLKYLHRQEWLQNSAIQWRAQVLHRACNRAGMLKRMPTYLYLLVYIGS